MKEERDVDDLTAIGSESCKGKKILFCGKFNFGKREVVSGSLAGGNVIRIGNFMKFVRQIGRGCII